MSTATITTTIEILGKLYPIRCPETELESLQEAALFLNKRMAEIQAMGKAQTLERLAILAGLNIANQFLQSDQQKNTFAQKIQQRLSCLQDKLEVAINKSLQTELVYSAE